MRLRRLFGWSLAAVFLVALGFVAGLFADRRYGRLLEGGAGGMMADGSEAARFYWSKGSETYLQQGQNLYGAYCGLCHGAHGNDGRAPDLTLAAARANAFDLLRVIQRGIPGTEMPPFAAALSRRQAFQIVAHLTSLQSAPAARQISGVPDKGASLVRSKGNCLQCHIIDGEGVPVGPGLRLVGRSRSPDYLRRKLVTPEREVVAAYRPIQVISEGGKVLRGFWQNEDSFSIQVRDLEGGIHSFWKQDVEVRQMEGESLMPSYKDVFSETEMQDVVAYLASLGRER